MMYKKIVAGICALFLFSASLRAQDYLDMRYQCKEGDQYQIDEKANQETYLTINEVNQRTSNRKDLVLLLTVKKILPGNMAEMEAEYKKIVLYSSQEDLTVSVNTEGNEDDIYNKLFKALIDKKFNITMALNGEITEVTGMDTIFSQMVAALPGVKSKEKPILKEFLNKQMGADQVKASLSLVLPRYPSFRIHAGDSWSSHLYTKGFYNGKIDNYWKLTFANSQIIRLENKGKLDTDPSEVVDLGNGQEGRMQLNGNIDGKYVINPATAWPTRSIIHTEINGKYTFFVMKGRKKKKKKAEIEAPVRIVRDASYEIKHL